MASTPGPSPESRTGFAKEHAHRIPELSLTLESYRHRGTGARHLHLASADAVNACLVGLHTPPEDDTGLTHVLEHLVLCGGQRFPAPRAFFTMLWRSACLTMNASASDDCTGYHFATRHRRDFRNLLQVYLDCLFHPRLARSDFEREGHRALPAPGGGTTHRGVVLSEMRGAMVDARVSLALALGRHLFPGSPYRFNTGGDPERLPELTLDRVRDYHRRHYHPANALFMTCGDIPAAEHQRSIETLAFEGWNAADAIAPAPERMEPLPLARPLTITDALPPDPRAAPGQSRVVLAWLLGPCSDPRALLEARLLAALLLGPGPTGLRARLAAGTSPGHLSPLSGADESRRRLSLCLVVDDVPQTRAREVEAALDAALEATAAQEPAADELTAALDRLELAVREVGSRRFPHGLDLLARLLAPVLHGGDPVAHLDLPCVLADLRRQVREPGYVASLVRTRLLDNPHRLRLTLVPASSGPAPRTHAVEAQSDGEPPAVGVDDARLPDLTLEDLDPVAPAKESPPAQHPGLRLYTARRPCGGLVHQCLAAPLPALEPVLAETLPLLPSLLEGRGDDPHRSPDGLEASLPVRATWLDPAHGRAALLLRARALPRHQQACARMLQAALEQGPPPDPAELHRALDEARAARARDALGRGHESAQWLAAASFGGAAALHESWHGLSALRRLDRLLDAASGPGLEALMDRLRRLVQALAGHERRGLVVADPDVADAAAVAAARLWSGARAPCAADTWQAPPPLAPGGTYGVVVDSPVGFAARAWRGPAPGHADAPALAVLGPLLTAGMLHERIRERGRAYGTGGGYCARTAVFSLFSYRDPQPLQTLAAFDDGLRWLTGNLHGERPLARAKIAALRELDEGWSEAREAVASFTEDSLGRDRMARDGFRDAVLAVSARDLARALQTWLRDAPATSVLLAGAAALRGEGARGVQLLARDAREPAR